MLDEHHNDDYYGAINMRTTITLDDNIAKKLKDLASQKSLSGFINQCILEHFEREEKARRMKELEKAYARAAKADDELTGVETEDWPEW